MKMRQPGLKANTIRSLCVSLNSYMSVNTRQLTVETHFPLGNSQRFQCPLKRNKCEASLTQTDRDTPIRDTISSETNITPVLLITHYPCKLTVLYFLYYIPCTRARFDKNELGGSGGRTGEVDRRKSDTTFFFAPTQFLEHPFARDQRFRRPFLLQLSFWSTPLSGIRDFDDLFLLQLSFRSTPFSGTRYFDDIFCFNSVFGAPLCPLTIDFDDLFQYFFSQQA